VADTKPIASGGALRIIYYILAAVCVFTIFIYVSTTTPDKFDAEIVLVIIIAVLLLSLMLSTSSTLNAIKHQLDRIEEKLKK
jgi:amino acid permease